MPSARLSEFDNARHIERKSMSKRERRQIKITVRKVASSGDLEAGVLFARLLDLITEAGRREGRSFWFQTSK